MNTFRHITFGLLACAAVLTACSDDETLTVNTGQIAAAPDFVDVRDGHTYHCIRIGNQEWTTENLAYYLAGGAADGCITWEEKQDIDPATLVVDTTNVEVVIDKQKYTDIYNAIADDPAHDWQSEAGISSDLLHSYLLNFYDAYGQTEFTNMLAYYPAFHTALVNGLKTEQEGQRAAVIDSLRREKAAIPLAHRDAAEAANGGYIATHGYLYTLDGARKAIPTEGGWRLPTDADWQRLEQALGMSAAEAGRLNAWRGAGLGDALKAGGVTGFNAIWAGCNAYQRTQEELFINRDEAAYFWAADESSETSEEDGGSGATGGTSGTDDGKVTVVYRTGIIRQLAIYSNAIWRGTTRLENGYRGMAYSVRLVRDVKP